MENEKSDNKTRILAVGERLFAHKGFDGVSIDEISKEAAVNKSMIYYYFSSKEGLLVNIVQKHVDEFDQIVGHFQISESKNIRDVIKELITIAVDYVLKNENIIKILHYESLMTRATSKSDIINFVNPVWNRIESVLRSRFKEITDIFILDKLICISLIIDFVLILRRLECETEEDFGVIKSMYIERIIDIAELLMMKKAALGEGDRG